MNITQSLYKLLLSRTMALVICMCACLPVMAVTLTDKAAQAYDKELYSEALELYLKAEKTEGTSAALCCNIGDTYYRLKDTPHAIVYYERALLLDPSHGDARFNLDFVRQKASIPEDGGASILSIWAQKASNAFSSNTWAAIAVVSFLLCLLAVCLYIFVDSIMLRKIGFFGGIVLLVFSVIANVCAFVNHNRAVDHGTAIVMPQNAALSTSPRAPKDKSEIAFELKQGRKVQLIDSVKVNNQLWLNVETGDSRRAWINAQDVEII